MISMFKRAACLILILAFSIGTAVQCSFSLATSEASSDTEKPLVLVLTNSSIYGDVKFSLDQFKMDVEGSGFSVRITETNKLSNNTPEGIRDFLKQALREGLVGGVLVGDIPAAWYKVGGSKFPTDMYYTDLDGIWIDSDNDTIYDEHIGDVAPEIWIGRLKAPTNNDEVDLINSYFHKNHDYRTGVLTLPWWRSLAYLDDEGVHWARDAELSLSQISTDITLVTEEVTTNAENYKEMLGDSSGYQWLYIWSHGAVSNHTFQIPGEQGQLELDGTVYSRDYQSINPRIFFYMLFVCWAARFTEPDYLAGSAVFANSYGLLALGSTDLMFSNSYHDFYKSLSEGTTIGQAFLEWFMEQGRKCVGPEERYDFQMKFYGLTIIGDPTLRLHRELRDVSVTDVTVSFENETGEETMVVEVTVENKGDLAESFNLTVHYDSAVSLANVRLALPAKSNATMKFTFAQAERFIYSDHARHVIEATIGIVPGEFETQDNARRAIFSGIIVPIPMPNTLSPVLFPLIFNVSLGLIALFSLKIFTSARLPSLKRISKRLLRR